MRYYTGVKADDEKMASFLRYLAKKLKNLGKKVIIFSSRKTISWEIKLEASEYIYLEDIKEKIVRR